MSDAKKRVRKRPNGRELEDALAQSMPSYTPQHRRAVLKGLRILARVAIRSYMEEQAGRAGNEGDGEERKRDGLGNGCEHQHGV